MGPAQWSTPCRGHAMWSLIFLCAVLFAARLGIINQKRYEREHTEEIGGMERTLALIKPHALEQLLRPGILKDIVDRCNDQNSSALTIARGVITDLPVAVVIELYRDSIGTRYWGDLMEMMSQGAVGLVELQGPNAVMDWRKCIGPNGPGMRDVPQWTVRKEYGIDATYNAVHGSDSVSSALRELELLGVFFSGEALAGLL